MERFSKSILLRRRRAEKKFPGLDQRYLIIVNPVSRGGKALEEYMWLLRRLRALGVYHEDFFTEKAGHAEEIVRRLVGKVDVVVAVGGDGTVNEVVNGMLSNGAEDKTLAVFPAGTADDFCHNVGIPRKRKQALETLLGGEHRQLDLIRYNDRYAAVTLGIGIDAEIAYSTFKHKRARVPAYFYVGLRICFIERLKKSPRSVRVRVGDRQYQDRYLITLFANAALFGRFIYLAPDAVMDDGVLNMSALKPLPPLRGFILLLRCFKRGYKSGKIIYESGREYDLDILEDAFMQVDGEVYSVKEGEHIHITVADKALKVRVPAPSGRD